MTTKFPLRISCTTLDVDKLKSVTSFCIALDDDTGSIYNTAFFAANHLPPRPIPALSALVLAISKKSILQLTQEFIMTVVGTLLLYID